MKSKNGKKILSILSFNICRKNHNLAYKNKNNDLEIHNLVPPKNIQMCN